MAPDPRLACTPDKPKVCVLAEDRLLLSETVARARPVLARLGRIPSAPTRAMPLRDARDPSVLGVDPGATTPWGKVDHKWGGDVNLGVFALFHPRHRLSDRPLRPGTTPGRPSVPRGCGPAGCLGPSRGRWPPVRRVGGGRGHHRVREMRARFIASDEQQRTDFAARMLAAARACDPSCCPGRGAPSRGGTVSPLLLLARARGLTWSVPGVLAVVGVGAWCAHALESQRRFDQYDRVPAVVLAGLAASFLAISCLHTADEENPTARHHDHPGQPSSALSWDWSLWALLPLWSCCRLRRSHAVAPNWLETLSDSPGWGLLAEPWVDKRWAGRFPSSGPGSAISVCLATIRAIQIKPAGRWPAFFPHPGQPRGKWQSACCWAAWRRTPGAGFSPTATTSTPLTLK